MTEKLKNFATLSKKETSIIIDFSRNYQNLQVFTNFNNVVIQDELTI